MTGLALECAARSDVGARNNNEDALYISPRVAAVEPAVPEPELAAAEPEPEPEPQPAQLGLF